MRGFATLRRLDDERRTRGLHYRSAPLTASRFSAEVDVRLFGVELGDSDLSSWADTPARLELDDGRWFEGRVTPEGRFKARQVRRPQPGGDGGAAG
jgi:hypothetical protein